MYKVANSLTRLIRANLFPKQDLDIAWESLSQLPIEHHRLGFGNRTVEIALTLERQSAYDAGYLYHFCLKMRLIRLMQKYTL